MALADELLDSISEEQSAEFLSVETNPHIVIDEDRNIILPERYKIIAAQGDHDMTTYTFDCPRFSDGRDMSKMVVYINYIRSDGETGSYPADNVSIDAQNTDLMHFDWTLLLPATIAEGVLAFLVCVCRTGNNGKIENHWSSRICREAMISEGMDCHTDTIVDLYPDIITRILERLNVLEDGGTTSVQYTIQDLEEEQKVQARKNIAAAAASEVSKLSEEIEETNKAVYITDTLLSFDNTKSFQYSDENLIVLLSTNFKKGEIISYLKIKNNAGGKIYLINDNDTVVRTIDYSVTSLGAVEETNVKLNYKCDENIRIAIGGNSEYRGSFMYNLSVDESFGTPVDFVKVFISDSVATFSNQNMKIVYAIEVVKKSTNKNPFDNTNVLLVDRNRRDAYNTINEAINSAKDSKENPVTILVMPGVYEEVVNIYGRRNLSIIGINKKDCILQYGSGKYLETPLRADGNFMVKNMTIKGTMEKAGNFLPTDEQNGFGCYALHIDDQHPNDNDNYHVIVDNCILYSEAHSAVGIGLHKNTTVELINCELQNNISESVLESSPKRSQYGALYAHSDVTSDGNNGVSTNQKLIVKNCRITTNTDKAIRLELDWNVQQTGNSVFYGFYHNAVSKSDNTVSEEMVDIVEWGNSEISHQMVDSCGNNIQKLNCNS